ncbi:MAG: GNAT family N-acetyltransferase, partial [Planctomycetes bacterium]|nr:GNAT family N-acetyltransferase [Planctomycetota bacterium]
MLSVLNYFNHGYVAVPILESCVKRGLFELLSLQEPRKRTWLIKELTANEGYFTLALQALETLGWIQKVGNDSYLLNKQAEPDLFSLNLTTLYAVSPENLLQDNTLQKQFLEKIAEMLLHCSPQATLSGKLLEGAVIVPLLLALKQLGLPGSFRDFNKLPHKLRQEIEALFFQREWIKGSKGKWTFTEPGKEIFNKTGVLAIGPSYRPMLFRMDQLLFGDSTSVFNRNQLGEESHVDRLLNVSGSGYQHVRYFNDAEAGVITIFNQFPLKNQPRAIADMGCGDGSFLKQLYEAIKTKTERGKHLEEFPLTLLGIDYNGAALKAAETNLRGLPYQTLSGDINDPDRLIEDLTRLGFSGGDEVLHVRSFLDHNLTLDSLEAGDRSLKTLSMGERGWHVGQDGNLVDSLEVLSRWKTHLKSWAQVLDRGSLLVLEAHSLSPQERCRQLEVSEIFYFDTLHSFSHQYLISAESFVILAANVGLFSKVPLKRYPKTLNFCRITLNHFEKRDYVIRHAAVKDLKSLYQLEKLCWKKELKTPDSQIKARIEKYPQGQFVLEKGGDVLGVIYSQRITSAKKLEGETSSTVHRLHDEQGEFIQLLAVNIHPEAQNQSLGNQLLEFMLQRCTVMSGIKDVLGVTLCKEYGTSGASSIHEYIRRCDRKGRIQDPILSFHVSNGATIDRALRGYRPEDTANEGFGILVSYDIALRESSDGKKIPGVGEKNTIASLTADSSLNKPTQALITAFLEDKVKVLLGKDNGGFEMNRPLIEMGLDSADLLELQNQITEKLEVSLKPAFFFQYNTIKKVVAYLVMTLGISTDDGAVAGALKKLKSFSVKEESSVTSTLDSVHPLKPPQSESIDSKDIAIVGISCRLPGGIETPDELWELLKSGGSSIEKVPPGRFEWPGGVSRETCPGIDQGGFIRDAGSFDAAFFRISPKEAETMDPQQRILLELSWSCLEDAGIVPGDVKGTDTGVFIGAGGSDYSKLLQDTGVEVEGHHGISNSMAVLANRISYFFDFSGPSMLLDTACSSSLVAVHTAVQSLRRGECSMALVGGVNLICHSANSVAYYKAGMLSPDGVCRVFDKSANGYVRAEGAVILVLKHAQKAIEDGDFIYAVIKGSALNHGGLSGGLMVPNPEKQGDLLKSAWNDAKIVPEELSYLEAHGTGTSLGDPIEVEGIRQAITGIPEPYQTFSCGLGSLKSNLGHLEAAAGIAGLLKVVLSLQKKQIPGSINFKTLNPGIKLEGTHLYIADRHEEWHVAPEWQRIAGVSSFGSGGANAHVVLEEYPDLKKQGNRQDACLFLLSACNQERLRAYAERIHSWIEKNQKHVNFSDFIYTFQVGRSAMQERLAMKVRSFRDLQSRLRQWLEGDEGLDDCWHEDSSKINSKFSNILKGEQGKKVIDTALEEMDFEQLATIWLLGIEIDWHFLHKDTPRRISVPSYPFSRELYWIDGKRLKATGRREAFCPEELDMSTENDIDFGWQFSVSGDTIESDSQYFNFSIEKRATLLIHKTVAEQLRKPIDAVDTTRGFFDLGLTSAGIVRMTREISSKINSDLLPSVFFEYKTISDLSSYIAECHTDAVDRLVVTRKVKKPSHELNGATQGYSLSEGQKGLWALQKTFPGMTAYNVPLCFRVLNLDVEIFSKAFRTLLKMYPILNSAIKHENGKPYQIMLPERDTVFQHEDISSIESGQIQSCLNQKVRQVFILEEGPLYRLHLFSLSHRET